jgi:hypothetical protein
MCVSFMAHLDVYVANQLLQRLLAEQRVSSGLDIQHAVCLLEHFIDTDIIHASEVLFGT